MQSVLDSMILTLIAVAFPAVLLAIAHLVVQRQWREEGLFANRLALGVFLVLFCAFFVATGSATLLFTGTVYDLPTLILGELVAMGFGLLFGAMCYTGCYTCNT